jgi:hypothetical protein
MAVSRSVLCINARLQGVDRGIQFGGAGKGIAKNRWNLAHATDRVK